VHFDDEGAEGLRDRRLGQVSPRRSYESEIGRMCALYRDRYRDLTVEHFHEVLVSEHNRGGSVCRYSVSVSISRTPAG